MAALPARAAPDNATIANGFVRLAFGDPARDEPPPLWRDGTVRVAVLGQPGRGFKAHHALGLLLGRLKAATGLDLRPAAGQNADIILIFVTETARDLLGPHDALAAALFPDRDEREQQIGRFRGSDCSAWFANSPGPPARMTRALGAIRRGQATDSQWACMVDIMVRGMGFRENRIDADWTMLGRGTPWLEPTEEDRLLLRLLYAPALAEQEDAAAALEAARRLLDLWRPEAAR